MRAFIGCFFLFLIIGSPGVAQETPCDGNAVSLSNTYGPTRVLVDRMKENIFCADENGFGLLHLVHNPYALEELLNTTVRGESLNPNMRTAYGRTPLFYVEYLESAQVLVNAGADPLVRSTSGQTPLFSISDPDIIEYLLDLGVSATARDRAGRTALHEAENPRTVQLLVNAGADVDAQNNDGYTPFLSMMYDADRIEAARALAEAGADYSIANNDGFTALHIADSAELVRFVVGLASDPDLVDLEVTNNWGLTPLHLAAYWNRADVIEELLQLGASPTALTDAGETPFDLVSKGCDAGLFMSCIVGTDIYWRLNDLRFD